MQDTIKAIRELILINEILKYDEVISFYQDVHQIPTTLLCKHKIAQEGVIDFRIAVIPSIVESSHLAKCQYNKCKPILDDVISFYIDFDAALNESYLKNFKEKLPSYQLPFTKRHEIMELLVS